jgi:DNA-binding MarR family transcriptional regulator
MTDTEMIFIEHDNPDIERIHVAAQSTRLWILNSLTRKDKMYASNLSRELNIERKIISFHLNALEKAELVKSEFGLSDDYRPAAVKYYQLTPKGREILEKILNMLKK